MVTRQGAGSAPTRTPRSQPLGARRPLTVAARRRWWIFGTLGVAAMTAMAVWFGLAATLGKVSWTLIGYKVVDAKSVDVRFEVDRPVGTESVCTLAALARDFSPVGSVDVRIPASSERTTVLKATIATTSEAVTGVVQFCRKL